VLVKLDFSNAFNSIHRLQMLHSVHSRIPELYAFCHSAYSQPLLFFGPYIVTSQEDAQQGDPIGPLLFCNTVPPLISSLQAELNLGYLDDVSLGGQVEMVASDVAEIVRAGSDLGLSLNVDKCELIAEMVASDVAEIVRAGSDLGLSLNVDKCELIAHSDLQVNDTLLQSFIRVEISNTRFWERH